MGYPHLSSISRLFIPDKPTMFRSPLVNSHWGVEKMAHEVRSFVDLPIANGDFP